MGGSEANPGAAFPPAGGVGNGCCSPKGMDIFQHLVAAVERTLSSGMIPWSGLLWLGFSLWALLHFSPIQRSASEAERITGLQRSVYSEPHEFAPVRVEDFRWLDARHYSAMQRRLEAAGFRCMGDLENISLSAVFPNLRTASRNFTGDHGKVTASVWQVKPRGWLRVLALLRLVKGDMRVAEFATGLSDGTFIATLDNLGLDSSSDVRGIRRMRLPAGTPVGELLGIHRQRVAAFLADHPRLEPLAVRSERELRESWARAHALKCAEIQRSHASSAGEIADAISAATNAAKMPATTSSV